jgi:biopolymer transport protein TolR
MLHNKLSQQRRNAPLAEINVVPYIDVMLVLLVIFMVTTPLLSQGIKVNLPKAQAQTIAQSQEPLIVSIDNTAHLYVNTAPHPESALSEEQVMQHVQEQLQLAAAKKLTRQVFVKADKDINYGKVVRVMVLLQKAGAMNIGLITESLDKQTT